MAPAATAEIAVRTACLRGVPPRNFRNTTGRPRRPAVGWRRAATWTSTWIETLEASRGFRASAAVESYTFVSSWCITESKCQGCSFAKSSSQYIYIYIYIYIYSIYLYSVYIYIYISCLYATVAKQQFLTPISSKYWGRSPDQRPLLGLVGFQAVTNKA